MVWLLVALAVIGLIAGFVAREPLERALVVHRARSLTGLDIDVARLDHDGAAYVASGVRVRTPSGAATLEAARARFRIVGRTLELAFEAPHVVFVPERYALTDRTRVRDAFAAAHAADTVAVHLAGGTLDVMDAEGVRMLARFDAISGDVRAVARAVTADVALQLVDGAAHYAVTGRTVARADGTTAQGWSAPLLPAAPLAALAKPDASVRIVTGMLRDLDIVDDGRLSGRVRLDDVRLVLGTHELQGLRGEVVLDRDGAGSTRIDAKLDGIPFDAAGEVHDRITHYRWLRDGTRDLRALARLTTALASEPRVRAVHLEATAPGLAYAQYGMAGDHGPVAVSVLALDPSEPTLRFGTAIAEDHVISGGERTSAMGVRTHAVGGVNGDYFDIGRTYQPQGMLVRGGGLVRGPTDRAVLAIDKHNAVTFSEYRLRGSVTTQRGPMPVTEFNDWPPGQVSIITPDYGKELRATSGVTFVRLVPAGARNRYRVAAVEKADAALPATFGIAIGALVKTPLPHVGETVDVAYETDPPLRDAVAAIGGGPILLRDDRFYDDAHAPAPDERDVRWPVVALARQRDGSGLMLVAVDGRHPERSVGMTRPEFAALLQRLGNADAMALDSGGSVTLISRAPGARNPSVRNVPSDNSAERWVSDALFVYSSAPLPSIVPPSDAPTPLPEARPAP